MDTRAGKLFMKVVNKMEKGRKGQKGGFAFLPLFAFLAKSAVAGAASAGGAHLADKALKGNGIDVAKAKGLAKKMAPVVKKKVMELVKNTVIKKTDISPQVFDKAKETFNDIISSAKDKKTAKKLILDKVAKPLIPLLRQKAQEKIMKKLKGSGLKLGGSGLKLGGQGLSLGGGSIKAMDKQILKLAAKNLSSSLNL